MATCVLSCITLTSLFCINSTMGDVTHERWRWFPEKSLVLPWNSSQVLSSDISYGIYSCTLKTIRLTIFMTFHNFSWLKWFFRILPFAVFLVFPLPLTRCWGLDLLAIFGVSWLFTLCTLCISMRTTPAYIGRIGLTPISRDDLESDRWKRLRGWQTRTFAEDIRAWK